MIKNPEFDIVNVGDEYLAIPIGEAATSFHGVVSLNEATAFLLGQLIKPMTCEELVDDLVSEYDVDRVTARGDLEIILQKCISLHLIIE